MTRDRKSHTKCQERRLQVSRVWTPLFALLILWLFAGEAAQGSNVSVEAQKCFEAAHLASRQMDVPVDVLLAITLTETGRTKDGLLEPWPWATNLAGKGIWHGSRDEALAFVNATLSNRQPNFDVGCFQLNYRWHGQAFSSVAQMLDPVENATYAARFLKTLKQEFGTWRAAAGAYHSRTPKFAKRYTARFDQVLAGLASNPSSFEAAFAVSAPERRPQRKILDRMRGSLFSATRTSSHMDSRPPGSLLQAHYFAARSQLFRRD